MSQIAVNIKLVSSWNKGASVLTFECPAAKTGLFPQGSTAIFTYGGANIFYGWLFRCEMDRDKVKYTCYDQLRYLKAQNSLLREVEPLDAFVNRVAYTHGDRIRLGRLDDTQYPLSRYNFDNKTYLDMIYQSIQDNLVGNGYLYTLRDNFGALDLRDTVDLRLPLVLGDGSMATEFSYAVSIDEDTYNYIKVAIDNKQSGKREVYKAEDSVGISKWGKLTLYEKVTADLNEAQLIQRANLLLAIKNRETETLSVHSMGDTRVMGGSGIKIEIGQAGLDTWAVVDRAEHQFNRNNHTMKLNLIFGRWY